MVSVDISALCKALSSANRLKIIQMLTKDEQCACVLLSALNITQPTLSHHMNILVKADIVHMQKRGKWAYYSLNINTLSAFKIFFSKIILNAYNHKEEQIW